MKIIKKYHEFLNDTLATERFAVLQGGRRSAKTTSVLKHIYLDLVQNRKRRAIIVTNTFARLRDSILSDYEEFIRPENPKLSKICWSASPRIDFLHNGNSIMFHSADRHGKGITSNKNWIFFNEALQYKHEVVRDILNSGADDCRVIFDYNPYSRFYVNEKYETATNKLITTYKDNPLCPAFAREILDEQARIGENAAPGTFQRYIYEVECLGIDSTLSGLCFPNSEIVPDKEYDDIIAPEILSSDWGQVMSSADPDVVMGFKFLDDRVYCKEYYYRNDGSDADIANVLKQVPFNRQWFVFETATAGQARVTSIYNISGLKFRFVPCSKGVGSVMIGIRNLQPFKICITESSLNMINEQQNYKYVTKGDILQPADRYNHAFDCLRYAYDFYVNNRVKIK